MAEKLNADALHHALDQFIDGWGGTIGEGVRKSFRFGDADGAAAFVDRLGRAADEADHHPGTRVEGDQVEVVWVTHSAGGVTRRDLEMAERTDALAADAGGTPIPVDDPHGPTGAYADVAEDAPPGGEPGATRVG